MPLVLWIPLGILLTIALGLFAFHLYIFTRYIPFVIRGFQERPLFIPPSGQPASDAEDVDLPTTNNLTLKGAYFKARTPRKGVILFGLEFGSNRWACVSYTNFLRDHGYEGLAASKPGSIRGHLCEAAFWDIGTPADYWTTNAAFLGSDPPERSYGRNARLDPGARVSRSILWDDVEIRADAVVEDCIVTDGVTVPAGAIYRRSVLLRDGENVVATPL